MSWAQLILAAALTVLSHLWGYFRGKRHRDKA
jgi:hypothetical protein